MVVAIMELVRRAGPDGSIDRGEWFAAVRSAFANLDDGAARSSPADDDAPADYLEEHVLGLLESKGAVEVGTERADRVRLVSDVWATIAPRRAAVLRELEETVRNLLEVGERGTAPDIEGAATAVAGPRSTLSTEGLVKAYRGRRVVNDVHIRVSQGEIVGLLGPNGAGKTTTFYMMVGLVRPDRGKVYLDDEDLTGVPMYARARRGIGYLAQEPSVFRKLTVEQNIMAILETLRISRAERRERLEHLLDELGLKQRRKDKAYGLSGGERRRLEITRALVTNPKFMLLDEPFAGVDPIAVHDIQQIVAGLRGRGIGVIITDHNVEQTLDIVDRAYIMYDGRVRISGTVAELVWNDDVAEIYLGPTLTARMRARYRPPVMV